MKFAKLNMTRSEQFQLGGFLDMGSSAIKDLVRDSPDDVINTFIILESWLDSRTSDKNSTALFDELSAACLNVSRCDLLDFVRCGK